MKRAGKEAGGNPSPQCAPGSLSVCLALHGPMTPPPKKHNFPMGLRVRVQSPSVAFPIYSQVTVTRTPKAMRPSYQKPNTRPDPRPVGPFCLLVSPKTSGCLALLPGPRGLRSVYLWLDTIVRRLSQLGEKAPIPRATFLGEATQ